MSDIALRKKNRAQKARRYKLKRFTTGDAVILAVLGVFALSIIYPFYNAVLVSFVPNTVYLRYAGVMLIPPKVTFDAYDFTFKSKLIWTGYRNSILVAAFGTTYNMLLTVLCAYAMTKPFPGRKYVKFFIVFTIYFTGGLIPYYLLIKSLNIMDSIAVMILPMGLNIMFMLIISDYFYSLPPSLEESAKIDGAGDFTVLVRIILPPSLPLLATFTLYYAVDRWNEWYHAMLFVKSVSNWPLQNVLRTIINDVNFMATQNIPGAQRPDIQGDAIKMSSIIVSMVPMMCLYPFLQRYFLSGLTLGAVKE
jgi:putative aldouronate transport system permease protein